MTSGKSRIGAHALAVSLSVALTIMYGIVPSRPELFGIAPRPYQMIVENASGAAFLAMIVLTVGYLTRQRSVARQPAPLHPAIAVLAFIGGCYWLSNNSWVDVREGFEGTISAVFRILWFVIIINIRQSRLALSGRAIYIFATIVLMFFDQSRTYFLIALLILVTDLGWPAIAGAIVMALLVAAIRSNENYGFYYSMMFAIGGEGYLGSQGVFQVLAMGEKGLNFSIPALQALFSPITAILTLFAKRLEFPVEILDSSTYLGNYIYSTTGQTYPPMGGFFIISEFIRAGWFGMVCMTAYMTTVYVLTKRMLDTDDFPIGSFVAILAIKNSPATYWTLVISVFIVAYAFRRLDIMLHSVSRAAERRIKSETYTSR